MEDLLLLLKIKFFTAANNCQNGKILSYLATVDNDDTSGLGTGNGNILSTLFLGDKGLNFSWHILFLAGGLERLHWVIVIV